MRALDPHLVERIARVVAEAEGFSLNRQADPLHLTREADKVANTRARRWIKVAKAVIAALEPKPNDAAHGASAHSSPG
jgi:hypothetical protein